MTEVAKKFIAQRQRPEIEDFRPAQPGNDQREIISVGLGDMELDLNDDWSQALFPQEFSGLSREDMLLSLIDPNTLQGFATESGSFISGGPFSYASDALFGGMPGQQVDGEFREGPLQNYY